MLAMSRCRRLETGPHSHVFLLNHLHGLFDHLALVLGHHLDAALGEVEVVEGVLLLDVVLW